MTRISLTVDGMNVADDVEPRMLLVQYLREKLGKTGTVVEVEHPTRGTYLSVGNPIKLSDSITEVKRSPLLGEHTDEILTDVLKLSAKDIAEIKASGALSAPEKKDKAA